VRLGRLEERKIGRAPVPSSSAKAEEEMKMHKVKRASAREPMSFRNKPARVRSEERCPEEDDDRDESNTHGHQLVPFQLFGPMEEVSGELRACRETALQVSFDRRSWNGPRSPFRAGKQTMVATRQRQRAPRASTSPRYETIARQGGSGCISISGRHAWGLLPSPFSSPPLSQRRRTSFMKRSPGLGFTAGPWS
jgi:hypothetical protein